MSEDLTLDEFINKDGSTRNEPEKPELIQGVAWSTIESIPNNWTINNVESDIEILAGNNFSSDYFTDEDGIPLIRIRDLAEDDTTVYYDGDYDSKYLINQKDLLVGMDGEFEPHLWTGPQALLNQRVCKIEPNERYNKIFFRYAIEKPLFYIQKSIAGTTVKHLSQSNINDLNLPTPPLEEQRKIATVLHNVDQAIQKTEEIIEQKEQIRTGLIQDVFTGVDADSTKSVRLSAVDTEIPEHWEVKTVGDVSTQITDGAHLTPDRSEDGYLLLSARNVKNGYLDLSDVDYVPEEEYERLIEKCNPQPGDILISCSGTVGRVCEVPEDLEFALVRSAALVKFDNSLLSSYAEKVLQSAGVQKQIKGYQTQSAQPNLFQGQIASLEIPIPPIEEQRDIAEKLDDVSDSINSDQRYQSQLKRLKHGLMQDLLSGTVRTADTNIEVPDEIAQHG